MATLMCRIDMPPKGVLEASQENPELTDDLMDEELRIRQEFLDDISPRLTALPARPLHRSGNVSHVELLGANEWTNLNHYLVVLSVDIGIPRDLESIVPAGGEMTLIGPYTSLESWHRVPAPEGAEPAASAA
jgi:hypothetical protein